jgi:NhaP-type Na+/H+ and K+/H+ antiporter
MVKKSDIELSQTDQGNQELALQTLYEQVVMDTKDIKSFLTFFKQATKRAQQLQDEYYKDVDQDEERDEDLSGSILTMLNDDPVFDITTDQHELVQKLLLSVAKYLNYGIS